MKLSKNNDKAKLQVIEAILRSDSIATDFALEDLVKELYERDPKLYKGVVELAYVRAECYDIAQHYVVKSGVMYSDYTSSLRAAQNAFERRKQQCDRREAVKTRGARQ